MRVALIAGAAMMWGSAAAVAEQPGVAVSNSPPPIVAVPVAPPPVIVPVLPSVPAIDRPTPPRSRIIRRPQLRTPVAALITPADYPASALALRQQGRADFTLAVGPDGRVHGCAITRSSGSAALDSATCAIMRRRARFTPAADSNGQPASASVRLFFTWRLPK